MSVFDYPTPGVSFEELIEQMHRVRAYIREARDPNETGENGRSLLLLAVSLCFDSEGECAVSSLLQRGADPNRPSPWANFTTLLAVSNSLSLVREFIDQGLRLNDTCDVREEPGSLTHGPSTLLDHVYAVRDYLSPERKKPDALATKYAGGLGNRRRFIDDVIELLLARGAKRAAELPRR